MLIVALVPLVVCVVGLFLMSRPPGATGFRTVVGDRMFTCGLLVVLLVVAHQVIRLP
jgi:hypothetical protein